MEWNEITTLNEWVEIFDKSTERGQLILKHSTTCPVSANALREFEDYLKSTPNQKIDYTLVKVLESRPVSNKIADELNVKHESPQMIFIKDKAKYWATSHWAITKEHMTAVLD
ncbi:bacillithiol system redox-active protein YtxJ [Paenibacillus sp. R14(2021)]|uniref:bacillithiol system redox-active protein YtxJ n=1 Tax=Paenibacillus sp. R14(2021) TaxID=2859228 RepID=UPI001C611C65|nr:bacillithiol system redox-active protein YtxJ [Paenibacillus sp. R14(2021)]